MLRQLGSHGAHLLMHMRVAGLVKCISWLTDIASDSPDLLASLYHALLFWTHPAEAAPLDCRVACLQGVPAPAKSACAHVYLCFKACFTV